MDKQAPVRYQLFSIAQSGYFGSAVSVSTLNHPMSAIRLDSPEARGVLLRNNTFLGAMKAAP